MKNYEGVETKVQKNWDTRETGVINYCWKKFYDLLIICKINAQNIEARSIPSQYHKPVKKTDSNDTEISRSLEKSSLALKMFVCRFWSIWWSIWLLRAFFDRSNWVIFLPKAHYLYQNNSSGYCISKTISYFSFIQYPWLSRWTVTQSLNVQQN